MVSFSRTCNTRSGVPSVNRIVSSLGGSELPCSPLNGSTARCLPFAFALRGEFIADDVILYHVDPHPTRPVQYRPPCRAQKVGIPTRHHEMCINRLVITVGTPKYLANKMKSKGLQRLRWYCQVCEKQCRDENGFKCHATSESHLRQMLVVGEHAGRHIADFSSQFQHEFVTLLSRRQVPLHHYQ